MSETKTPRTDKIMQLVYSIASACQIQDYPEIEAKPFVDRVMSETSQLETELNEARAEIERLNALVLSAPLLMPQPIA